MKLAIGLSNEKIINFQTKFREHFNRFDFDKNNIEHLTYLLTYLKGLSVKKFKYPLAILNSINGYEYNKDYSNSSSYCINYTKPIKDILISLIIKDEDCLNAIINTDFISDIKRILP